MSVAPGGMSDVVTNSGGGFDFGNILKGAATKGLDALLGGLFGRGSGSKDGNGPFSEDLMGIIQAGPAAYFDNELVERATQRVNAETLKNLNQLRNTLNDIAPHGSIDS